MSMRTPVCLLLVLGALAQAACAPEAGSEAWCERLAETPRGDWTANQAVDYARHCLID